MDKDLLIVVIIALFGATAIAAIVTVKAAELGSSSDNLAGNAMNYGDIASVLPQLTSKEGYVYTCGSCNCKAVLACTKKAETACYIVTTQTCRIS